MRRILKMALALPMLAATVRPATAQSSAPAQATPAAGGGAALVEVKEGTVEFKVDTNVPAINVHGKSKALVGKAYVRSTSSGASIEQLEAKVPIESLGTGLGLRDAHMRKHVFTTPDGRQPELRFQAESARCSSAGGRESKCELAGTLSVRDVARPFAMALDVSDEGGKLRAKGDGQLKLSSFGIERPSNLGVQTADDVTLHLEFTATRSGGSAASGEKH
jgi:polyisoprenoid-binding protein YceI